MLCSLGDFMFETDGVNLQTVNRKTEYSYAKQSTISGFNRFQTVGRHQQNITLAGKLIQQNNKILEPLEQLAAKKRAVTLAYDDGRAASVLITSINTDESNFLRNGRFLSQDFEVSLEVLNGSI